MSNIVIDESRILQLEEDRVTLRNNLRAQGIACEDDDTIETLLSKMSGIISWLEIFDKSYSGELIDANGTLTSFHENATRDMTNITVASFPNVTGIVRLAQNILYAFSNCQALQIINLPLFSQNLTGETLRSDNALIKLCFASSSIGNIGYGYNSYNNLEILDVLNTNFNTSVANCNYIIIRDTDTIAPLSNASNVKDCKVFLPQTMISTYESATNWSATSGVTFITINGSRFENKQWLTDMIKYKCKCTLDGNTIDVLSDETVAIFKHTENISHCYENGVELQDTDLVKGKTLTSTI